MGVNRYTSLTPSQFNPLSLEEIMLVPAMQRKKHDDLSSKQEDIRLGLAKVDPLDVHYDEAIKLKSEIESELDNNATTLAKTGVNDPNVTSKIISLNRRYNDLISPTGRIGQINTAKQIYDKKKALFLDNATKQYGSNRAVQLWEQKIKDENTGYKGYDAENKIINVGDYGIVGAEDYEKDLQARNNILGSTMSEIERGGGRTVKNADGSYTAYDSKGREMTKTNLDQVNQMTKAMEAKWLTPGGAGHAYNQEAGINNENFTNQFKGDMLSQLESAKGITDIYSSEEGAAPVGDGNVENGTPTGIFDPTSQKTVGQDIVKVDFSNIGKEFSAPFGIKKLGVTRGTSTPSKSKMSKGKHTYKDVIPDPLMQTAYENTFNNLIKSGKLPKNSNINDNKIALIIEKEFKTGNVKIPTIGNDIIMADISPNSQMFMGELANKDEKSRNTLMQNQLDAGLRTMIDPVSGKELTPDEFREKGYTVEYIGYDSPVNYRGYNFKGGNQNTQTTMAHKVNIYDKDGKSLGQAAVTRSAQEVKDPKFQKAYQITHIYRNAVENFNNWVTPKNIKNTKVKFKDNGLFDIQYNGKTYEDLNNEQYQIILDELMTKQSQ